mgnify:CR=1 FL=1
MEALLVCIPAFLITGGIWWFSGKVDAIELACSLGAASQTRLIDQKRSYATSLSKIPFGFIMTALGYPKINFGYPKGTPDDYPVISTARANDVYEKGQ